MQRITSSDGLFHDGNPATNAIGTFLAAAWHNAVQEEIAGFIESAGIKLDPNSNGQLLQAFAAHQLGSAPLADKGTVNAYAATNIVPLTANTLVHGVRQRVTIGTTNSGASTYSPDGLPPKPILGLELLPLEGLELLATQVADLEYVVAAAINGGNGAWLLLRCAGGAMQIPAFSYGVTPGQNDNSSALATTAWGNGISTHGQCRLSVVSPTSLKLSPYNGRNIIINGTAQQIPAGGVTIGNSGLTASTLYYVYAAMSGGSMVLAFSGTGHSTASNGIETMTTDTTKTLVGMVYTNALSQFSDAPATRYCLNWFNRRVLAAVVGNSAQYNFTSPTFSEISTSMRVGFLTWGEEAVYGGVDGEYTANTVGASVIVYSSMDGGQMGAASGTYFAGAGAGATYSSHSVGMLSEGPHTASVFGEVTGGSTGTFVAGDNAYIIRG